MHSVGFMSRWSTVFVEFLDLSFGMSGCPVFSVAACGPCSESRQRWVCCQRGYKKLSALRRVCPNVGCGLGLRERLCRAPPAQPSLKWGRAGEAHWPNEVHITELVQGSVENAGGVQYGRPARAGGVLHVMTVHT